MTGTPLVNSYNGNHYTVTTRKKFDTIQEISERHAPHYEYENFVTVAVKIIPTKPRAKCRVPWEAVAIRKTLDNMKKESLLNKRTKKNINARKRQKIQKEIRHTKMNSENTIKAQIKKLSRQ